MHKLRLLPLISLLVFSSQAFADEHPESEKLTVEGFISVGYMAATDNNFFGDTSTTTSFGIQGYLGLDYAFEDIPLNITADWIPTIFLNGFGSGFGAGYGTLGVRYILNQ